MKDRRGDYSWQATKLSPLRLAADKRSYSTSQTIRVNVSFRVSGGLREAFHPDVWTVAWEDFDKILRLTLSLALKTQGALGSRKFAEFKKEVR